PLSGSGQYRGIDTPWRARHGPCGERFPRLRHPHLVRGGTTDMEGKTTRRAAFGALGVVPVAMLAAGADSGTARAQAVVNPPQVPFAAAYGVDVRREGAVGDGTTDDAPAFTAAFEKASSDGGNLVIVPPGSYRIAAPLTAQAPVHLTGLGGEASSIL